MEAHLSDEALTTGRQQFGEENETPQASINRLLDLVRAHSDKQAAISAAFQAVMGIVRLNPDPDNTSDMGEANSYQSSYQQSGKASGCETVDQVPVRSPFWSYLTSLVM